MSQIRTVAILVFPDIEVLDFAGPFEVFNVARELVTPSPFEVYTVGVTDGLIAGRGGFTVQPHYTIATCPPPNLLIIPGGFGTRGLLKDAAVIAWVQQQAARLEILMSVCTGSLLLAKAGLLANTSATTHHTTFDLLAQLSPTTTVIKDQRFVDHGRLITSGGISAGIDMSLHVVERLLGAAARQIVETEMEYGWHQAQAAR